MSSAAASGKPETYLQRGFTLLEMLISVTLLAALSILLLGGMRFGSRVWERTSQITGDEDDLHVTREFLRRVISRANPVLRGPTDHLNTVIEFDGQHNRLTFLAPMPVALGAAGLGVWMLEVDGQSLIMKWRPELAQRDVAAWQSEILVSHVQNLAVSYFGSLDRHTAPSWHDDWRDMKSVPPLVRINLIFSNTDKRVWRDLFVAPAIDVDATCTFDPLTRYCVGRTQ